MGSATTISTMSPGVAASVAAFMRRAAPALAASADFRLPRAAFAAFPTSVFLPGAQSWLRGRVCRRPRRRRSLLARSSFALPRPASRPQDCSGTWPRRCHARRARTLRAASSRPPVKHDFRAGCLDWNVDRLDASKHTSHRVQLDRGASKLAPPVTLRGTVSLSPALTFQTLFSAGSIETGAPSDGLTDTGTSAAVRGFGISCHPSLTGQTTAARRPVRVTVFPSS